MKLTGKNYIGNQKSGSGRKTFQALNPVKNEKLEPLFHEATKSEVNKAVEQAEKAFRIYSRKSGLERAAFLEAVADEITALGDALIDRCSRETGLSEGRLTGERGRTTDQLRLFAELLRDGSWVDARIDTEEEPEVRSMQIPLGPAGIFGASNFPLAFSVAGGDTASALAAGCSIVVKGHPAHPGTSEMIAEAIMTAVNRTDMPEGTFSMVHGTSHNVGMAIVEHPLIKAIGFTGSFKGGKAIYDAATSRPEPIPVYAEMGSTNPIFILPGALEEKWEEIAEGLTHSVNLGAGQFCTNPGLVAFEESKQSDRFLQVLSDRFKKHDSDSMLTPGIYSAYKNGIEKMNNQEGVEILARGDAEVTKNPGVPFLLQVDSDHFLSNKSLEEEVFGPSTLTVKANGKEDLLRIARNLSGHLTATLYGTEEDLSDYSEVIDVLRRKAGRLIFNGFPTGVKVCHSMVHGGPFPATTDSRTTSVGTAAITRFTRPVSYQNFPDSQLPDELKKDNPLGIWRLENGERTK